MHYLFRSGADYRSTKHILKKYNRGKVAMKRYKYKCPEASVGMFQVTQPENQKEQMFVAQKNSLS